MSCGWGWKPCLWNNQLLLPTLCVQAGAATALGVCLCKGIICLTPQKPQGNKTLPPGQCSTQNPQTPILLLTGLQLVDCGPAEQCCKQDILEHRNGNESTMTSISLGTHQPPSPFYTLGRAQGARRFACNPLQSMPWASQGCWEQCNSGSIYSPAIVWCRESEHQKGKRS